MTRTDRYQTINNTMKGLAFRNRRDEPLIPGDSRMLADELDMFEAYCPDLDHLVHLASGGTFQPLAEAIIAFRSLVMRRHPPHDSASV